MKTKVTKENKEVQNENKMNEIQQEMMSWVKAGVLALFFYICINFFIFTARVDGPSMLSTFTHGDLIFVNRIAYTLMSDLPEYEDIVIFTNETRGYELIKRVIGLPGDHIQVKDGQVYRNGTLLQEDYLDAGIETEGDVDEIVKEGYIFVMGDNRPNSADSRLPEIGQVSMKTVKGKVFLRIIPNPQKF